MSTSRFCPGCTGRAQPPASTGRALPLAPLPPLVVFQQAVHEGRTAVVADVLDALAVGKELDALDEARRVGGAAEHVAGAVQVPEGEGQLHRLAVEEIHSGGQRNAADPRGRRGESRQRAWEILNRFSALDIVGVARGQLVVEGWRRARR